MYNIYRYDVSAITGIDLCYECDVRIFSVYAPCFHIYSWNQYSFSIRSSKFHICLLSRHPLISEAVEFFFSLAFLCFYKYSSIQSQVRVILEEIVQFAPCLSSPVSSLDHVYSRDDYIIC